MKPSDLPVASPWLRLTEAESSVPRQPPPLDTVSRRRFFTLTGASLPTSGLALDGKFAVEFAWIAEHPRPWTVTS